MVVTLKDISQQAQVTEQTVSRALGGHSNVGQVTALKIKKIAKDLGYRPNLNAQSLRRQRSKVVGFIFPDITHSYAQNIADGARAQLSELGYLSLIGLTSWNSKQEACEIDLLLGYQVEALVCQPIVGSEATYQKVVEMNVPLVFVGNGLNIPGIQRVGLDGYDAGSKVIEHLLELGHRRIAFVGTDHTHQSLALSPIKEAYSDGLKAAGIVEKNCLVRYSQTDNEESVKQIADDLIGLMPHPTAIFCISDAIAYSMMSRLIDKGLRIPQDISITGMGDLPSSSLEMISLTTVTQDPFQIGFLASQSVLELLDNPGRQLSCREIQGDLISRKSTAPIVC